MKPEGTYWSRFAKSYERDGEHVVGRPIIQTVEERLSREHWAGEVIDLGCGSGGFTAVIAKHAERVVAADLSDEMLEVAAARFEEMVHVQVEKADCTQTPYASERFDGLLAANLLHVISEPQRCLAECHRILKKDGMLLVVDFTLCGMGWLRKTMLGLRYLRTWGKPPSMGKGDLSLEELVAMVREAGFAVEAAEVLEAGSNALYLRGRRP